MCMCICVCLSVCLYVCVCMYVCVKVKVSQSCLTFVTPSPGQNPGVGSCFLLQWIFPTQESNLGLLHCRLILYQLKIPCLYKGSLYVCVYVCICPCVYVCGYVCISVPGGMCVHIRICYVCVCVCVCVCVGKSNHSLTKSEIWGPVFLSPHLFCGKKKRDLDGVTLPAEDPGHPM